MTTTLAKRLDGLEARAGAGPADAVGDLTDAEVDAGLASLGARLAEVELYHAAKGEPVPDAGDDLDRQMAAVERQLVVLRC